MGDTRIEWATKVWNSVDGCDKVSAGCKYCYAERIALRFWGNRKFTDVICHSERLDIPLKWKKPQMIFVDSMSDLFHPAVPFAFIEQVFETMLRAKQHTFMVLTKRPERAKDFYAWCIDNHLRIGDCWPLKNVWLGVSVENHVLADERIPILLKIPAVVHFVSCEPLLGGLQLFKYLLPWGYNWDYKNRGPERINWVICGCESGPHARPMEASWAQSLRDQCHEAGVPFFLKQMSVDGKLVKEPFLDGRQWLEFPEVG